MALGSKDPYQDLLDSEKADISGDYKPPKDEGQGSNAPARENPRKTATDSAKSGEKDALSANPISTIAGGADKAKSAEQSQPQKLFTGKGKDIKAKGTGKKGLLRRKGPIIFTFLLIGGSGALLGGMQSLFPFHLAEKVTGMFDGSYTSRATRMPKLALWLFNLENNESKYVKQNRNMFKNTTTQKFRTMSKWKTNRLASQGVTFTKDLSDLPNGATIPQGTTIVVKDGVNAGIPITLDHDVTYTSDHPIFGGSELRDSVIIYTDSAGNTSVVSADTYGETYSTKKEFQSDVNRGARTIVGRLAAWIDLSLARFLANHSLTKNLFKNWQQKVFDAEGRDTTFRDIIRGRRPSSNTDSNIKTETQQQEPTFDENGDPDGGSTTTKTSDQKQISKSTEIVGMVTKIGQVATSIVCGVSAVYATISAIKAAQAITNAIEYVSAILESVSKTKAGQGSDSPVHESSRDFIEPGEDGYSATQAEGLQVIMSAGTYSPNTNDPSTVMTNIESAFTNISNIVSAYIACTVAQIAFAAVSIAISLISFGTFSVGKALIGSAIGAAITIITKAVVDKIISSVTTNFCVEKAGLDRGSCAALGANSFLGGNFKEAGGGTPGTREMFGNFYDAQQTALAYEAELDRSSKSPFDLTSPNTFLGSIVAKAMPYISQLSSVSGIMSSVGSIFSQSLSKLLPSASAIDKTSYMDNIIGNCPALESIGAVGDIYCKPLIMSDISTTSYDPEEQTNNLFCNSSGWYQVGDQWKCKSPTGNFEYECIERDADGYCLNYIAVLDSNDNEIIRPKTNLGKFILYCTQRQSMFGIVDHQIAQQESSWGTVNSSSNALNTATNSLINGIPLVSDALSVLQGSLAIRAIPWTTGSNCVARDDSKDYLRDTARQGSSANLNSGNTTGVSASDWQKIQDEGGQQATSVSESDLAMMDTVSWSDMKKYQRYMEDNRILESAGVMKKSPVISFLERWEEEHPLDNSYEGILARQTGYSKEQISQALDEMYYQDFIANYDPSDRLPLPINTTETTITDHISFAHNPLSIRQALAPEYIIYTDIRYRSFAA